MTNPFQRLNKHSPEALHLRGRLQFEHTKVRFLMDRSGLQAERKKLSRERRNESPDLFISFARFREEFPTYPVLLGSNNLASLGDPLHKLPKAAFPVWFKKFMSLPFLKFYEELYEECGEDAKLKPVGMVFPRKGFKQGLIIHNGLVEDFVPPLSSCHVFRGGDEKHERPLVVQPFTSFVDYVYRRGHGWSHKQP